MATKNTKDTKNTPNVEDENVAAPTFAAVKRPEVTRKAKANPYEAPVAALQQDKDDEGGSVGAFEVTVPASVADTHVRLAQKAGRGLGVTVRQVKSDEDGSGNVTLTFWTVPKIVRKRSE